MMRMLFCKMRSTTSVLFRFFRCTALVFLAVGLWPGAARVHAEPGGGTWVAEQPLPEARAETAATALLGQLHEIGGVVNNVSETAHDAYDPATNTWRSRAPLPEARDHVAVVEFGGKLFAFGGFSIPVHKGAKADTFAYDPASDSWRRLAPMPTARGSAGAAVVDGKIHVIGGRGVDGVTVAAHEVYDPGTNQWNTAAPLPLARDHLAVVAAEGKIHVIGGRRGSPFERTGQHDVYDPKTSQ